MTSLVAHAASLQQQIDAATPGTTITVPAGTYEGALVIDKPLTLIGTTFPTIQGNGTGKVVHIAAEGVALRGFRIRGSGLALSKDDAAIFVTADRATIADNVIEESLHGIYLKKANDCRVLNNRIHGKTTIARESGPIEQGIGVALEDCAAGSLVANRRGNGIHQWNCNGNEIAGNEITEARDGIYFSFTNHAIVRGNTIHHVRYGLHYMYSDDNLFVGNTFSDNAAGAALMFSKRLVVRDNHFLSNRGFRAYGIILQSVDDTRLENNVIEQNAVGLSFSQCNRNLVTGNRVAQNYIGLRFGGNSDENAFSVNSFLRNVHPVEMIGESGTNRWSIAGVGNYWDGAVSFDLDRDGINDMPHRELDLFGVLRRDFPAIAFLSESPAVKLLRFAHERATLPGLNSIEDPAPLASQGGATFLSPPAGSSGTPRARRARGMPPLLGQ
ncbi:MAG: NosD domain-containing protein [Chthoniobacteraceae bacterium]